jgi:hypothetical protein
MRETNGTVGHDYSQRIDRTELRTVKWYLRSPESEIDVVILLAEGEDLAQVARTLDCGPGECRERALALARRGAIRLAVNEPAAVRAPWTPYVVCLDDFGDERLCWVIYAPPAYFVELEREAALTRRDAKGRS